MGSRLGILLMVGKKRAGAMCMFISHTHTPYTHTHRESVQIFYPNSTCACFTHPCLSLTVGIATSTILLAIIWAATNYMYSRALVIIDPTDVTALFSSAPAFVFLFSICILREPPLVLRVSTNSYYTVSCCLKLLLI